MTQPTDALEVIANRSYQSGPLARIHLFGLVFLFLWGHHMFGESCRILVKAEDNGINGKQGAPPGPAILFGPTVSIPSFQLRFVDMALDQPVRPLRVTIAYGWRWLEYPYPEHSWGAWAGASDVFECTVPLENEIEVPAFEVRPRGWYDGKYTRFPFSKKPAFSGIGVVVEVGGCTTRATITTRGAARLKGREAVFKANCKGESLISIQAP